MTAASHSPGHYSEITANAQQLLRIHPVDAG
jgi:hypothetical protein